ncbi:uncharacterized protein MONBRDRAFT_31517 [Monosiga brevicollis MX1]|uniref:TFIIS N-terminal domain-containing protein n=1 Tax=Monosiga brevicollis TaxID=81824 RepID=A9UTQ2_MONBE|nr:uncharacterized protein MONBRDRAFT_31517 [Monosiga brevicollis MX1]EDQ91289.1 predicted protein [Monosiga brevicollis MX1]|eukprot:XP_001743711.1 hypothetical protein [Monosiga brevicollis MX1]
MDSDADFPLGTKVLAKYSGKHYPAVVVRPNATQSRVDHKEGQFFVFYFAQPPAWSYGYHNKTDLTAIDSDAAAKIIAKSKTKVFLKAMKELNDDSKQPPEMAPDANEDAESEEEEESEESEESEEEEEASSASESEEEAKKPSKKAPTKAPAKRPAASKPKSKPNAKARKSAALSDSDDDDDQAAAPPKRAKAKAAPKSSASKSKPKTPKIQAQPTQKTTIISALPEISSSEDEVEDDEPKSKPSKPSKPAPTKAEPKAKAKAEPKPKADAKPKSKAEKPAKPASKAKTPAFNPHLLIFCLLLTAQNRRDLWPLLLDSSEPLTRCIMPVCIVALDVEHQMKAFAKELMTSLPKDSPNIPGALAALDKLDALNCKASTLMQQADIIKVVKQVGKHSNEKVSAKAKALCHKWKDMAAKSLQAASASASNGSVPPKSAGAADPPKSAPAKPNEVPQASGPSEPPKSAPPKAADASASSEGAGASASSKPTDTDAAPSPKPTDDLPSDTAEVPKSETTATPTTSA